MTGAPAVSVIVPAFNPGRWLMDCVQSVLGQSMEDLELIVVDDGSTDGSVRALADAVHDDRLTLLSQPNAGASAARNKGLARARGQWVCFLDADDLLHEDKLRLQLDYHQRHPQLRMSGAPWCRFADQPPSVVPSQPLNPKPASEPLWHPMDAVAWQIRALKDNLMMHPAAWLTCRDLVRTAGPWDPGLSLNDDGEFFARQMLEARSVGFCDGAWSFYRSGIAGSLSGGRSRSHMASALRSLDQIAAGLRALDQSGQSAGALAAAYSRLALEAFPRHRDCSRTAAQRAADLDRFAPQMEGGLIGQRLARVLGWRTARALQWSLYSLGYRRSGNWRLKASRRHGQDQ